MGSSLWGEPLDGVTQHRSGHVRGVLVKKCDERGLIDALARLPQHPADRLVDEIVRIIEQPPGDGVGRPVGAGSGGGEGGHDRYAPLPHVAACDEIVDSGGQPLRSRERNEEPGPHEVLGRGVHQVPVVDQVPADPVQISPPQLLAPGQRLLESLRIGSLLRPSRAQQTADSLGLSDGDAQRGHPLLVPGAGHQTLQLVVVEDGALRNGANLRDGHAVEAVALSIAAGHGTQVAGDLCRLGFVGQFDQGGAYGIGRGENRLTSCWYFRNHHEDPANPENGWCRRSGARLQHP